MSPQIPSSSSLASTLATEAIHGGTGPDPETGALLTPVHQNTTYAQSDLGVHRGFSYSRTGNPTVSAFEKRLAALEQAHSATAFATGMAATTTLFLSLLKSGDRVICSDVVYGGTVRVLRQVLQAFGVNTDFIDTSDLNTVKEALRKPARLVFLETPANPTLKLSDIEAIAQLARKAGAWTVVDNTFLTPVLQRPLDLGADVSLYSTTKYIEGHNSTVGGALLTKNDELAERLRFVQGTLGTTQAPWEAWLSLRGVKTLPLRMERHSANAASLAAWLEDRPEVERVDYPFSDSFPQVELARRQQKAGGGLISFRLKGGLAAVRAFAVALQRITLAENLGAVESLITHPVTMTHASVPESQRLRAGIVPGLLRLSVGLEDPQDLIADLEGAFQRSKAEAIA